MDFRIRNIKNHLNMPMEKQADPMLSALRELTEVMKLSHQHFIDAQKERLETKQVLMQIKSSLDQKESALSTVSEEIKKITEKTVEALTEISQKILGQTKNGLSANEVNKTQKNKQLQGQQQLLQRSQKIMQKMEEICTTPLEPRNIEIIVEHSSKETQNTQKNIKFIKSDIAKLSNKIFSISFNMFFKQNIDFDKTKAYCSENMLGNLIQMVKSKQATVEQIQMIDQHLSNMVLPYLKLSYPHSEEKETSSKLVSLIVQKDIFNENRFDLLYNSPVKKMTWYGLEEKDMNNDGNKTQKQFMRLMNYIISLPDQSNELQQKTLFECFQEDMAKSFEIVYNKDLTQFINNSDHKIQPQQNEEVKLNSITNLLQVIEKNMNLREKRTQKEISQYREKVKSYTKYKIGRKISTNSKLYTQNQIQKGRLTIKDQSIRRIMTKWIQSLQQVFQNPVDFTILRNELQKLDDGTQNNNEKVEQKQKLFNLIKRESTTVKQKYGEIKKNLYETFRESIINQQYQLFDSQFCSQRQAFVGNTCKILSGATERYIIKYLVVLINSLKKIENYYSENSYSISQNQRKPLLVNLKLGDLMRCQLSSKESEVVTIYKFLILLCEKIPDKFELVRVKNRFNGPNKDILINIWYHKTIMVEIQLAIKNESPFLECSDKYSHFIYELKRDILGPISELAWCSNCKVFQNSEQLKIECGICRTKICSMCRNTEEISKQYQHKRIQLNFQKLEKGFLAKGIEIKTKEIKLYFFMEFMGRMRIISFRNNKNQFSEIQTKYEESNQHTQNESSFAQFINQNYLISDDYIQIDQQALISQIFTEFWQKKLAQIDNKKKSIFSIIFFSKPSLKQKKNKIVDEILKMKQNKKKYLSIEKINISHNQIEGINGIKIFKNTKQINIKNNKIKTFEGIPFLPILQQINLAYNQLQSLTGFPLFINLKKMILTSNKIKTLEGTPQLSMLQDMDLRNNQLQSLKGLPSLMNLRFLNIYYNRIKTLQETPQLPLLQQINLVGNKLRSLKGLPPLMSLKILNCRWNRINRLEGIPSVPMLQQINLANNQLECLQGFPLLMKLKQIAIQCNIINTLQGFPQLPKVQIMDLRNNRLQSIKGLPSLMNLKKLFLNENKLTTMEGTPQLPMLQYMNLDYNQLQSLKGLPQLINLKKMVVTSNKINTLEGTPQLPSVQQMILSNNQIQSLKGLPSLLNLKILIISYNQINTLELISQLPLLQEFNLEYNKLESLKGLPYLINLKKMYIRNNKINTLEGTPQLPLLESIDLSNNELESLKGLPLLMNLKKIYVNSNKINTLNGTPDMPLIQQIYLGGNLLQSLKGLPSLINLKRIDVYQNRINTLEGTPQLPLLEQMNMPGNQLKSLKGLPLLMNLKQICIRSNQISTLEGIPSLPLLQNLNLQQNQLQSLKELPLLMNLKKIFLRGNKIANLEGIPQLQKLQIIDLAYNRLYSLKGLPSSLLNLRRISIKDNNINTLEGTPQLPLIQQLDLAFNQLQSLKGLPSLINLKILSIFQNKVNTLQGVPQLPRLYSIDTRQNPINKDPNLSENLRSMFPSLK